MTKHIDLAIDALLNDNPVEALGHLMLHKVRQAEEAVNKSLDPGDDGYGEVQPPPIQPLKPKKGATVDVSCPTCKAKPGKPCFRLTSRGPHGKPTDQPLLNKDGNNNYHRARVKKGRGE